MAVSSGIREWRGGRDGLCGGAVWGNGSGESLCGAYGGGGSGDFDECLLGAGAGDEQSVGAGGGPHASGGAGTGADGAGRGQSQPTRAFAGRLCQLGGAACGIADADAIAGEGAAGDLWVVGIVCYGGAGVGGGIDCDVLRAASAVSVDGGAGAAGWRGGGGGIGFGMRVD